MAQVLKTDMTEHRGSGTEGLMRPCSMAWVLKTGVIEHHCSGVEGVMRLSSMAQGLKTNMAGQLTKINQGGSLPAL